MMGGLGQYMISVAAAAVICGVVSKLTEGSWKEMLRLLCGLVLTVTVLRPLAGANPEEWLELPFSYSNSARAIAQSGENMAREAMADIIKSEAEAYILDKAAALNADITVEVIVADEGEPVPAAVRIRGQASPYARRRLESIVQTELGIGKEDQQWTG